MTATEYLEHSGFECLGPDPRHRDVTLWLCTGSPDILVQMTREDLTVQDAMRAIYAAGTRDKAEEIAGRWKAFTDALRAHDVSELWTQARTLQKERQEAITEQISMPRTG